MNVILSNEEIIAGYCFGLILLFILKVFTSNATSRGEFITNTFYGWIIYSINYLVLTLIYMIELNVIISGFLIGLVITIFGMIFRIENFSFKDNLKRTAKEIVLFIALYLVMIFLLNLL